MAVPVTVEGSLNPLRPGNYDSANGYRMLMDGLLATGHVVRTDEDTNSEFPVADGVPFSYSLLGNAAVFAVSDAAAREVLGTHNRGIFSSFEGGTGILPFEQTNPGRQVQGVVEVFGEGIREIVKEAVVFGDPLTMDRPSDHRLIRSVILEAPEFKGRNTHERETPIEAYIGGLADTFVDELSRRIDAGEEVEITDLAAEFTYRTIAHIIGIDLRGDDGHEKINNFLRASQQAFLIGDEAFPVGASYVGGDEQSTGRSIMHEARRVLQVESAAESGNFLDKLRSTKFTESIRESAQTLPDDEHVERENFIGFLELAAGKASELFGPMTADEFIAAKLLLVLMPAGSETTSTVITRGIAALVERPDQRRLLHDAVNAGDMERPVEELIRFASPVNLVARTALSDTVLMGSEIKKGDRVYALIGAANHDSERYTDPWELKLDRSEGRSLAFGDGPHNCPGALLAKTELSILFSKLSESGILDRTQVVEPGLLERTTPQLRSPKSLLLAGTSPSVEGR